MGGFAVPCCYTTLLSGSKVLPCRSSHSHGSHGLRPPGPSSPSSSSPSCLTNWHMLAGQPSSATARGLLPSSPHPRGWVTAGAFILYPASIDVFLPLSEVIVGGWQESWWTAWLHTPHLLWKPETNKLRLGNTAPFKPATRRWQVEAGFRQKLQGSSFQISLLLLPSKRTLCLENCELTSISFLLPSGFSC